MNLDLGPFSSESFDPKKWINSACQTRHPHESLDKHLVDLEMKLQMVSEEIAASLEELSASALLRVPRATRDVIRLRDDAVSIRSAVSGILQKLKKVTPNRIPSNSVAFLFSNSFMDFRGSLVGLFMLDLRLLCSVVSSAFYDYVFIFSIFTTLHQKYEEKN